MRIDPDKLQEMFDYAGVNKDRLYLALCRMGPKHLHTKEMREKWTPENPTYCYCYVIAEFVHFYICREAWKPYSLKVPGDPGLHRFHKTPSGIIVDLAAEQFDNYEEVDYNNARGCGFLQTGCKGPSRRTRDLAALMGYKSWSQE